MRKPGKMLFEVLQSVFKKPATVRYPFVKVTMPASFRGKLKFKGELCIGCKLCVRDCPTSAIVIRKVGDKKFEADIDLAKCIYCAQCADSCPKDALAASPEFELAQLSRDKLRLTFGENSAPGGDQQKKEANQDATPKDPTPKQP